MARETHAKHESLHHRYVYALLFSDAHAKDTFNIQDNGGSDSAPLALAIFISKAH